MPEEIVSYITRYGYLAIFVLVFLQETGMPNPFPNELLLMFSGYLSFKGFLFLPFVILTAVTADFIGTNLLYFLFYRTGFALLQKKPKWLPVSTHLIENLTARILKGGTMSIFLFRLTPFTRGYASVITGFLQVKPKVFLPVAFVSATTWAALYSVTGFLIGPSWDQFMQNLGSFKYYMGALFMLIVAILLVYSFKSKWQNEMQAK
jgi:membrane protein DedA with SNARE-associated domain